jgi:hypothetical protein
MTIRHLDLGSVLVGSLGSLEKLSRSDGFCIFSPQMDRTEGKKDVVRYEKNANERPDAGAERDGRVVG